MNAILIFPIRTICPTHLSSFNYYVLRTRNKDTFLIVKLHWILSVTLDTFHLVSETGSFEKGKPIPLAFIRDEVN
jgi:hypothetical protein